MTLAEQVTNMDNQQLLARLVEITNARKTLEKEVEEIKKEAEMIRTRIMEMFITMGVTSMKAAGKTLYIQRQLWAGTAETASRQDVVAALEELGMNDYVSFNIQSLSGYVREEIANHEEWTDNHGKLNVPLDVVIAGLPEPLNKVLKLTENIDIKIRS